MSFIKVGESIEISRIENTESCSLEKEIILVDDGSDDGTWERALQDEQPFIMQQEIL